MTPTNRTIEERIFVAALNDDDEDVQKLVSTLSRRELRALEWSVDLLADAILAARRAHIPPATFGIGG